MRRIMIEVDCGKRKCKACEQLGEECGRRYCDVFGILSNDIKGRALRCLECIAAEDEASKMTCNVSLPPVPELFYLGKEPTP